MMYTAWNVWKEHNRRIFEGKSQRSIQVARMIKNEMALLVQACGCGNPELFYFNVWLTNRVRVVSVIYETVYT
ncbi:hypothetical protein HU200_056416 [Digitaria exilis]|uniref:Uncharacterized protein n=1 Tax=Digitaria exilis TaxID=1010633 RepID=A0A835E3T7_9POAL|nr:hypothetical protein HU200_056416 [Digitaria exilis]